MTNIVSLRKTLFYGLTFAIFASVSPSLAIEEGESEPTRLKAFLQESDYMTGNWGRLRDKLEARGVDIYGGLIMSPTVLTQGRGASRKTKGSYRNMLILGTQLDTEKMGLYRGGKFTIQYMAGNGSTNPADYFGSFSEIDCLAPEKTMSQITQLYYEHTFKDDLFSIKVGKQNANEDFHHRENSGLFLNHSYHVSPNIPLPDCLTPQMGARAKLKLSENIYLQAGIYDGDIREGAMPKAFFTGKNGYVSFVETQYLSDFKNHEGKYLIGGWLQTSKVGEKFEKFDINGNGGTKDYNNGAYFAFEQKVFNAFEDNSGGLSVLGQFSLAPSDINEVPIYSSLGLVWSGIGEKRKDDKVGVALAWHQYNNTLKELENRTSEKVIELFYKFKVTNFLFIKPGAQYIIRPEGNGAGSFALGVRTVLAF